ncbi:MAG: alpha/beta fold hydrolase [Burkholderiales bacterium]
MADLLSTDRLFDDQAQRTLAHALFGGADLGECITTMQRVPAGDMVAWQVQWQATAERVAALGDAAAARGHRVSAREAWLRAANYFRTAYLFAYGNPVPAIARDLLARETAVFAKAAAALEPALVPLEIPYAGTTLPACFCPAGPGTRPLLVCTGGYDSTLRESYFAFAVEAQRRGWHALLFDGPGQGRVVIEQGLPMRGDWEAVVRPVLDVALTLPGVDPRRVVLTGWSLGGYLSLRAAAFEPRLAACVSDPGLPSLRAPIAKMFAALPPSALADPLAADPALFAPYEAHIAADPALRWKVMQRGYMVHGVDSVAGYVAAVRDFDATPHLADIRCPVYLGCEENDPLAQFAPDAYAALNGPKTLQRFAAAEGAGDHTAILARSLFLARMFDWLDEVVPAR